MFLILLAALSHVDRSLTRGSRDRRGALLAHLLQDRAAGDLAGHGDRHPDPRPRSLPHLRHDLGLTGGGPGTMTETISIYTYVQGFQQFESSYTAAIAFLIVAF